MATKPTKLARVGCKSILFTVFEKDNDIIHYEKNQRVRSPKFTVVLGAKNSAIGTHAEENKKLKTIALPYDGEESILLQAWSKRGNLLGQHRVQLDSVRSVNNYYEGNVKLCKSGTGVGSVRIRLDFSKKLVKKVVNRPSVFNACTGNETVNFKSEVLGKPSALAMCSEPRFVSDSSMSSDASIQMKKKVHSLNIADRVSSEEERTSSTSGHEDLLVSGRSRESVNKTVLENVVTTVVNETPVKDSSSSSSSSSSKDMMRRATRSFSSLSGTDMRARCLEGAPGESIDLTILSVHVDGRHEVKHAHLKVGFHGQAVYGTPVPFIANKADFHGNHMFQLPVGPYRDVKIVIFDGEKRLFHGYLDVSHLTNKQQSLSLSCKSVDKKMSGIIQLNGIMGDTYCEHGRFIRKGDMLSSEEEARKSERALSRKDSKSSRKFSCSNSVGSGKSPKKVKAHRKFSCSNSSRRNSKRNSVSHTHVVEEKKAPKKAESVSSSSCSKSRSSRKPKKVQTTRKFSCSNSSKKHSKRTSVDHTPVPVAHVETKKAPTKMKSVSSSSCRSSVSSKRAPSKVKVSRKFSCSGSSRRADSGSAVLEKPKRSVSSVGANKVVKETVVVTKTKVTSSSSSSGDARVPSMSNQLRPSHSRSHSRSASNSSISKAKVDAPSAHGGVRVILKKGVGLVKGGQMGVPDPYVVCEIGGAKVTGESIKNGYPNPIFEGGHIFELPSGGNRDLKISCHDQQFMGKDALMGNGIIDLATIPVGASFTKLVPLNNQKGDYVGSLEMEVETFSHVLQSSFRCIPLTRLTSQVKKSVSKSRSASSIGGVKAVPIKLTSKKSVSSFSSSSSEARQLARTQGGVRVVVRRGVDLGKDGEKGEPNPYVVCEIGGAKVTGEAIKNTLNPVFGDGHVFELPTGSNRDLKMTVFDKQALAKDAKMGKGYVDLDSIPLGGRFLKVPLKNTKGKDVGFLEVEIETFLSEKEASYRPITPRSPAPKKSRSHSVSSCSNRKKTAPLPSRSVSRSSCSSRKSSCSSRKAPKPIAQRSRSSCSTIRRKKDDSMSMTGKDKGKVLLTKPKEGSSDKVVQEPVSFRMTQYKPVYKSFRLNVETGTDMPIPEGTGRDFDPFVEVRFGDHRVQGTTHKNARSNHGFHDDFFFPLKAAAARDVYVTVVDQDVGPDRTIGSFKLDMNKLNQSKSVGHKIMGHLKQNGVEAGRLLVKVDFLEKEVGDKPYTYHISS